MTIRAFSRRRLLTGTAAISAAAILPRTSYGSDWRPTETVRLIVPAAAGGTTDVMGRLLAAHLQTAWGQSAVVENRSGGGGTIGTAEVVRSKGGRTHHPGRQSRPQRDRLQHLPQHDLQGGSAAAGLQHDPDSEHRVGASVDRHQVDRRELIAYIKANPDKLTYASSGVGQSPHLTGAWFLQLTGLKMVHVPFRGAGPALQAALAGDIQILFDNLYPTLPQVQDGKLTALAVTTTERSAAAPNIPTMRESAPELAKFDVSSWFGIFLPKAAPAPVVEALNKEIKAYAWSATTSRNSIGQDGRTHRLRARRSNSPISCRRRPTKFGEIIKREGLQMDAG